MARIIATDGMAKEGVDALITAGHTVDLKKVTPEELIKVIKDYDALIVRSATQVTADVLKAGAPRLKVVGRAGVGVDNVDCKAATQAGVIVLNAPLGNILSAAEHTIGMLFAVARCIPQAHGALQKGVWDKKTYVGVELHGKTLGVIGLGKIGKHVAKVMQAAGMKVVAADPFLSPEVAQELNIEPVDIDGLLAKADFITLHVPKTDKTTNMLNAAAFAKMKPGVRLVNVARGGVINEADLVEALKSGKVAAAALDVFAKEPLPEGTPLLGIPNLITTPHLGASTEEAQVRVSTDVADALVAYFKDGAIINAVNIQLNVDPAIQGYLRVAEALGKALAQTLDAPLKALEVRARGELANYDIKPLSMLALKGALAEISDQEVNLVNAPLIAQERGITLTTSATGDLHDNLARLMVKATTTSGERTIGGALVDGQLKVLRFDEYAVDLPVGGNLLIMEYPDRPGMVGSYGSILGQAQINIARMEVSRIDGRGDALVLLTLDDPVTEDVLARLREAIKPRRMYDISL